MRLAAAQASRRTPVTCHADFDLGGFGLDRELVVADFLGNHDLGELSDGGQLVTEIALSASKYFGRFTRAFPRASVVTVPL